MTLIDDDQVEEIGRKLGVDVLLGLGAGDGLVKAQVDLEGFVDGAIGEPRAEALRSIEPGESKSELMEATTDWVKRSGEARRKIFMS